MKGESESIENISSVGYDENSENEVYALAILNDQQFAIGDDVEIGTADKECFGINYSIMNDKFKLHSKNYYSKSARSIKSYSRSLMLGSVDNRLYAQIQEEDHSFCLFFCLCNILYQVLFQGKLRHIQLSFCQTINTYSIDRKILTFQCL